MLKNLTVKQTCLATCMSDISERCYYAGWMQNLEFVLWDALVNGERRFGRGSVTYSDIEQLKLLSDQCACWIYLDEDKEEEAISLEQWKAIYEIRVNEHPDVLKG